VEGGIGGATILTIYQLLQLLILMFAATTLLSIATKGKDINIGRARIKPLYGGLILFLGGERKPKSPKPFGRAASTLMLATSLAGILLFYVWFVPTAVNMIIDYIRSATQGGATPQPVAVPVPLLFQFSDIVLPLLISLGIGIALHEFAHAVVALREGVPVKSWGVGVFLLIPFAFVEVDEEAFRSSKPQTRRNILAAGLLANALIALASFALLYTSRVYISSIVLSSPEVEFHPVVKAIDCSICNATPCPAMLAGIRPGDIIYSMAGKSVNSSADLAHILGELKPGDTVDMVLCRVGEGCRNVTVVLNATRKNEPGILCLGVSPLPRIFAEPAFRFTYQSHSILVEKPLILRISEVLIDYSYFIFVVNASLFVFNAAPIFITDGSQILRTFTEQFKRAKILEKIDYLNAAIMAATIAISSYLYLSA